MATVFNEAGHKKCTTCSRTLLYTGIHMGIPFTLHEKQLYCSSCYDKLTTKDNIQRTGDEIV
jgi:hypothetical protein